MKMKKSSLAGVIVTLALVIGVPTVFSIQNAVKANISMEQDASNYPVNEQGPTHGSVPYASESTETLDKDAEKGNSSMEEDASNYPVNEQGQTYGPVPYASKSTETPDLISATGENGVVGYVKATDLDPKVSSPEEAMAYQKSIEAIGYKSIPLYEADGKTVIGEFRLSTSKRD